MKLKYKLAIRVPGRQWWTELEFMYDTGADCLSFNENDIPAITGPYRDAIPLLGEEPVITGNGTVVRRMILVEITILDNKGRRMCPWVRVDALVEQPRLNVTVPRVDGRHMRRMLYYSTVPTKGNELIISNSRFKPLPAPAPLKDRADSTFNSLAGGVRAPSHLFIFPPVLLPIEEPIYTEQAKNWPKAAPRWA